VFLYLVSFPGIPTEEKQEKRGKTEEVQEVEEMVAQKRKITAVSIESMEIIIDIKRKQTSAVLMMKNTSEIYDDW
jgi:hypothetical protein